MCKWFKEQWEWLVMCFAVWVLDVFDERKEKKEKKK